MCSDEAASLTERAERVLYFLPHELSLSTQLQHVDMYEGLLDFVSTFCGPRRWQCLQRDKRRYAFLEVEPDVWMIMVLVKPVQGHVASSTYPRSTDIYSPFSGAAAAATGGGGSGAVAAGDGARFSDSVSDETVLGIMQRLYNSYVLFYGTITRVLQHPNCVAALERIAVLAARSRVLRDKLERVQGNIDHLAVSLTEEDSADAAAARERVDGMRAELITLRTQQREVEAQLAVVRRFSPVAAVRYTLRSVLDFTAHYVDWVQLMPYDAMDAMRYHRPAESVWRDIHNAVSGTKAKSAAIEHVALAYDGIVVYGRHHPGLHIIMAYLRAHAFHVMRGTYLPDRRPLLFASTVATDAGSAAGPAAVADAAPTASSSRPSIIRLPTELQSSKLAGGGDRSLAAAATAPTVADLPSHATLEDALLAGELPPWCRAVSWADTAPSLSAFAAAANASGGSSSASTSPAHASSPAYSGMHRGSPAAFATGLADSTWVSPAHSPAHSAYNTPPSSARNGWTMGPLMAPSPLLDAVGSGSGMPRLHRELKPSCLATPALPAAAAARRHMYAAAAVDAEWPVLQWPYVCHAYMETLATVLATNTVTAPGSAAAPFGEGADTPAQSSPRTLLASSSALGPPASRRLAADSGSLPPPPPAASSILRSTSNTSMRSISGASVGNGRPRAGSTSTATSTGSAVPDETSVIFCPAVFANDPAAAAPSHRVLWLQAGLVTVLVYVRAEALLAPVGTDGARADVWPPAVYAVADAVRDALGPRLIPIESAINASLDQALLAARRVGLESTKHVHIDELNGLFRVAGFGTLVRQPGAGRDASSGVLQSQAAPMPSAAVSCEIPMHLTTGLSSAYEALAVHGPLLTLSAAPLPVPAAPPPSATTDGTVGAPSGAVGADAMLQDRRGSTVLGDERSMLPTLVSHACSISTQCALASSSEIAARRAQQKLFRRSASMMVMDMPAGARKTMEAASLEGLLAVPAPRAEQHTLATRYEGAVSLVRIGGRETFMVFDGRTTVDMTSIQARATELATLHSTI